MWFSSFIGLSSDSECKKPLISIPVDDDNINEVAPEEEVNSTPGMLEMHINYVMIMVLLAYGAVSCTKPATVFGDCMDWTTSSLQIAISNQEGMTNSIDHMTPLTADHCSFNINESLNS